MTSNNPQTPGRHLGNIVRVTVSFGLLALLFFIVDIDAVLAAMAQVNWLLFSTALVLSASRVFIVAARWQVLLRDKADPPLHFLTYARIYFVSSFFGLVLPTVLGGDAARVVLAARKGVPTAEVVSSILVERVTGFLVLSLIALGAMGIGASLFKGTEVGLAVWSFAGVLVVFFVIVAQKRAILAILGWIRNRGLQRVATALERVYSSLYAYHKEPGRLGMCFLYSLLFQGAGIVIIWVLGESMGVEASFIHYLVFVPLVWVATTLPVSISGFGVREGAFVALFGLAGVPNEQALALSLLFFAQFLAMGLVGAGILLVGRKHHPVGKLP